MDVFTALADQTRRDLLRRMAESPARVVDLAAGRTISRPAVSKHLRVLSDAGLVAADDRGRERHYRLDPSGLLPLQELLDDLAPELPVPERVLDGLDLEVRRVGRDRRAGQVRRTTAETRTG